MSGMQWHPQADNPLTEGGVKGSWCEVTLVEGLRPSRLDVLPEDSGTWSWEVSLYATGHEHWATGYGCATEGKARFMAMSLVSALLQIIDGVKPHEVD